MEGKLHVSWDVKFDDDESREICIELAKRTHLPVNLEKIYLTRTKVVASLDCLFRAPYLLRVLSFRSHLHTGIGNKRNLPIGRRVSGSSSSVVWCVHVVYKIQTSLSRFCAVVDFALFSLAFFLPLILSSALITVFFAFIFRASRFSLTYIAAPTTTTAAFFFSFRRLTIKMRYEIWEIW